MIYNLYDNSDNFGLLETNLKIKKFQELLEKYQKEYSEDYSIDEFINYLNEKGHKSKMINADEEVYF